jgi:putative ABC transport system substrate-binding protein
MDRRGVLARLGGALLLGVAASTNAQDRKRIRRIGSLGLGVLGGPEELRQIWAPARELGWIEGQNLTVERRWTTDPAKLRSYAEALVRLDVELILANGTAATRAAKSATTRIPIIMLASSDPVGDGLVEDLARPGGNVTGYSSVSPELTSKRVEILRELLPSARRVGVLIHPPNPTVREDAKRACRAAGLEPVIFEVTSTSTLGNAIADAARQRMQALIVRVGGTTPADDAALMRAAIAHSLPTVTAHKAFVEVGGLVSLMSDETEQYRIFAYYIDRVLRGARPNDLPIQQPTKFVLSINLKTAKALGVTVPPSMRARADEVIE